MSPGRRYDAAFPTLARYVGLSLGSFLVLAPFVIPSVTGFSISEVLLACAGGYPFATGLVLYKTVKTAAQNGNGQ
jgi:hypothetical protein